MTDVLSYRNKSIVCSANQWTGFRVIGTFVMNQLLQYSIIYIRKYLLVFAAYFIWNEYLWLHLPWLVSANPNSLFKIDSLYLKQHPSGQFWIKKRKIDFFQWQSSNVVTLKLKKVANYTVSNEKVPSVIVSNEK